MSKRQVWVVEAKTRRMRNWSPTRTWHSKRCAERMAKNSQHANSPVWLCRVVKYVPEKP